jgi:tRNA threonylcarbamoyladenosine biosynthesis protein TsaE
MSRLLKGSSEQMDHIVFNAVDETDTARLGAALAETLPGGTVVALYGTLGAGKTRLVQAVAEALGINRREVVSPTFVLIQEHHGKKTIYHIDAYRLRDDDEFLALGPDEYFEGPGLVFVEWADRISGCLPEERVDISVEIGESDRRQFDIAAKGAKYKPLIADLAREIG